MSYFTLVCLWCERSGKRVDVYKWYFCHKKKSIFWAQDSVNHLSICVCLTWLNNHLFFSTQRLSDFQVKSLPELRLYLSAEQANYYWGHKLESWPWKMLCLWQFCRSKPSCTILRLLWALMPWNSSETIFDHLINSHLWILTKEKFYEYVRNATQGKECHVNHGSRKTFLAVPTVKWLLRWCKILRRIDTQMRRWYLKTAG